eukprot:COSAG03_NODE_2831_length_2424_cov_7.489462_1_plen_70_part_10
MVGITTALLFTLAEVVKKGVHLRHFVAELFAAHSTASGEVYVMIACPSELFAKHNVMFATVPTPKPATHA